MLNRLRLFAFALLLSSFTILVAAQEVMVDSDTFSGLSARPIGPAAMGGRIADIVAVQEGPRLTIYIGSASGGVWKSPDGGTTFKPVFDKQSSSFHRLHCDRPLQSPNGVGWHRRVVGPQQCFCGDRYLSLARWWRHLGKPRAHRFRAPQPHRHSPQRQQYGLRMCPRTSVELQPGAWHLQDHGWRQELEEGSVSRRKHGLCRDGNGSAGSERTLCRNVGRAPAAVQLSLRRSGKRAVQEHRRRRNLA